MKEGVLFWDTLLFLTNQQYFMLIMSLASSGSYSAIACFTSSKDGNPLTVHVQALRTAQQISCFCLLSSSPDVCTSTLSPLSSQGYKLVVTMSLFLLKSLLFAVSLIPESSTNDFSCQPLVCPGYAVPYRLESRRRLAYQAPHESILN